MRADSLASNFLQVMEENDLDRPIQMDGLVVNMTPTPYARPYEQTWSTAGFVWRTE